MEIKPAKTFLDTGLGDEIFEYEVTDDVSLCIECRFRYNLAEVAPCCDCNGLQNPATGRDYFQYLYWEAASVNVNPEPKSLHYGLAVRIGGLWPRLMCFFGGHE